ncbi:proline dehydrogenase [Pedobacter antarcticus 4BY]|uniref:proline dehydrogenase n=2 Tax=Pedobacter antarcticus TaxID=34086 RepID=A0A081PDD9_9SPHI|nr:proline dehydrogenase family protein [Pedobacter antarcticus]KEQ28712.1 proline dehydrogenase [Pedobacter antarcticus 4BY]SFE89488.1 L-proline dehydrogenase [Pedobacter antarcticus]
MDKHLLQIGSQALRTAALNEDSKAYILANPVLFQLFKKAANRYIGGENLEETIVKVKALDNLKASIEFMGESTRTEQESNNATKEFIHICEQIRLQHLNATVSLDLSHIGLAVSKELCLNNLNAICNEASKSGIEIIISAEGTERTDDILETYKKAIKNYDNLAITLQAYLYRTKDDFAEIRKETGRIRIVKGAFETANGLSMSRGEKLDDVYLDYIAQLLAENHKCSIATHDKKIQSAAKLLIQKHNPSKENYEFESLFGICNDQLYSLKDEGYQTKLYFVYGKEWYLYLCNRIAEYPMSIFQALNDVVQ